MINAVKTKEVKEFGDFQTPDELAFEICRLIARFNVQPKAIIEPTCGLGNFIHASSKVFYSSEVHGFEVSAKYVEFAENRFIDNDKINISQANFFEKDWKELVETLPKPLLVIGNPPWVTNSQLSVLESKNIPRKDNAQNLNGFDAMTGKSNFDISEWIMIELLKALAGQDAVFAILCKTSVAGKVLKYAWKHKIHLANSAIYKIDTKKFFDAAVDACLLFGEFSKSTQETTCKVFQNLADKIPTQEIGYKNNSLIASIELYEKTKYLNGGSEVKWRSGIKHDCSKVMELTKLDGKYKNNLGETINLEDEFVFPMLKSSDLANGNLVPKRQMIVTQQFVKDDTSRIADIAPETWNYLLSHAALLDNRKSSIYKNSPRFAIFGIGSYSFAPWKVAISGFYKRLNFNVVGSYENKPIILDDTCYFIPFETKDEAENICELLNSEIGQDFFKAFIFWDEKRPIKVEILEKLNINKLKEFGKIKADSGAEEAFRFVRENYQDELVDADRQTSFDFNI
jgi:hypothetical protein